jgi:hypothetical protein
MRQWAIAIGINQYHVFQPLSYAQRDAQALHNFLVEDAGFPLEQCILLSDTSPTLWGRSTYPTGDVIQNWLDLLIQTYVQPDDSVWFFFSGYGVCEQGHDYLIPIAGDPTALSTTTLSVAALFHRLKVIPSQTVVVVLDISRSQGTLSHEVVGIETAQLARDTGISTILSCQPGQFSRESAELRHGFFTVALLEGLRHQQCTTVAALDQFLSDRLAELGDHHWRPTQQPLTIVAPDKQDQILLPHIAFAAVTSGSASPDVSQSWSQRDRPVVPASGLTSFGTISSELGLSQDSIAASNSSQAATMNRGNVLHRPFSVISPNGQQGMPSLPANGNATGSPSTAIAGVKPSDSETTPEEDPIDPVLWRSLLTWGGIAVVALLLGVLLRNWDAFTPRPGASSAAALTNPTNKSTPPQAVTAPLTNPVSANSPLDAARAKLPVQTEQASPFWYAIQEASRIQPGQPHYQAAQQEIAHWSQTIVEIAKRRIAQRNYDAAILAARLVPQTQPVYRQANLAIAQACPLLKTQPARNPIQQKQVDAICHLIKGQ